MKLLTTGECRKRNRLSEYQFNQHQRFAVFTTHGPKCYINNCPIDMQTMEIDHVIPEFLVADRARLDQVIADLGLPSDFDVNSYENWLPSCRKCNSQKSNLIFESSLLLQRHLQVAANKAAKARELEQEAVTKLALSRAINTICRAVEGQTISNEALVPLIDAIRRHSPELVEGTWKMPSFPPGTIGMMMPVHVPAKLRLTPYHTVVMEDDWKVISTRRSRAVT